MCNMCVYYFIHVHVYMCNRYSYKIQNHHYKYSEQDSHVWSEYLVPETHVNDIPTPAP